LVVVGVIGLLAGLLLPAVQASREAARRTQCANNLRQMILATANFASAQGGFPSAVTYRELSPPPSLKTSHASLHCQLLGYMEEAALFNAINFEVPMGRPQDLPPENQTAAARSVGKFLCPSDPLAVADLGGGQSYRGNDGLDEVRRVSGPGGCSC